MRVIRHKECPNWNYTIKTPEGQRLVAKKPPPENADLFLDAPLAHTKMATYGASRRATSSSGWVTPLARQI